MENNEIMMDEVMIDGTSEANGNARFIIGGGICAGLGCGAGGGGLGCGLGCGGAGCAIGGVGAGCAGGVGGGACGGIC